MFCKNCGAQMPDNQPFCPACGAANAGAQQPPQQPQYQQPQQPQYQQQPYAQPQYQQPVRQPKQRTAANLDLPKLFTLCAAGVFLLCCIFTLFKLIGTSEFENSAGVISSKGETDRLPLAWSFDLVIINLSGILALALGFFGAVKSRLIPMMVSIGASLSAVFVLLLCMVNASDANRTTISANYIYRYTSGLSVVGWLMLVLELGAGALCVLTLLGDLKNKKK